MCMYVYSRRIAIRELPRFNAPPPSQARSSDFLFSTIDRGSREYFARIEDASWKRFQKIDNHDSESKRCEILCPIAFLRFIDELKPSY